MNPDKNIWDLCIDALKGSLDDRRRREFEYWISREENRRFYENLRKLWLDIRRYTADYEPDAETLWHRLQQRIENPAPAVEAPRTQPFRALLRTAAIVAVAVGATWLLARTESFRNTTYAAQQRFYAFEGKSQIWLTDGSSVWLHGGATLCCDGSFGRKTRDVELSGEGFFDVAKDPERPFTVEIAGLKVRVHGTRFNIRTLPASGEVLISLLEGSVTLDTDEGPQRRLRPGEIARFDPATHRLDISHGNVAMESCWTGGKLVFEQRTLGDICRYMARWYDVEIDVAPALARNYAYTFTITDEPLEEILRIMSRINPIVYKFSENRSISISEIE